MIFWENIDGKHRYQATPEAVQERIDKIANQKLNEKIDDYIKQATKERLDWDRWPKKYWILVSVGTAIIGGIVVHLLH